MTGNISYTSDVALDCRTALVAGATGLTGTALTRELLTKPLFSRIKLITRKELEIEDSRIEPILIQSLDEIRPEDSRFSADVYFCCLGTTIKKAGSKKAFEEVDLKAVVNVAQAAKVFGAKKFILISAAGTSEDSPFFYSRIKAAAENEVMKLEIPGTCIFRPSLLIGERREFRLMESLSINVMRGLEKFLPGPITKNLATNVDRLVQRMIEESLSSEQGLKIIGPSDI